MTHSPTLVGRMSMSELAKSLSTGGFLSGYPIPRKNSDPGEFGINPKIKKSRIPKKINTDPNLRDFGKRDPKKSHPEGKIKFELRMFRILLYQIESQRQKV